MPIDDEHCIDSDPRFESARERYHRFRSRSDVRYLLRIGNWYVQEGQEMAREIKILFESTMAAHQLGRDLVGIVRLEEFNSIPSEARGPVFSDIASAYWDYECLAYEYQHSVRKEIHPESILISNLPHAGLTMSAFGTSSSRVIREKPKPDAVFAFLADKFEAHPSMVEYFHQFKDEGRPGEVL